MKRADWADRPAVIIASGPSLSDEQLELVRLAVATERCNAIAVNNTALRAHFAPLAYFGDYLAVRQYLQALRPVFRGLVWTGSKAAAERWHLPHVRTTNRPGLGETIVHLNGNSGFQALNLATLLGARRVLLLGFDMRLGADGRKHWFGDHPAPLVQEVLFDLWRANAEHIAVDARVRGIEIVNATPGSALECFERVELGEVLR